ncbi:MAG: hypothetical protein LUD17_14705 [Bacteroidales bacterium]|nr:hypothetical protein [Bacteroidales bacterium]
MDTTNREALMRLLQAGHPGAALGTDEEIFGLIIDDYAEYARLLEAEEAEIEKRKARDARRAESLAEAGNSGLAAADIDDAVALIDKMTLDAELGIYSADSLRAAWRALHYDADVAAAEVRGRNAQIQETILAPEPTDGLPHLSGADAYIAANPHSIFALAHGA